MKIYHNPRCRKSRQALSILEERKVHFEIINYIKNPITFEELEIILVKLKIKPIELIRTQESVWKEKYKHKTMSDDEMIKSMLKNPKLMERPIVMTEKKAVIGRPPENILKILN